MKGSFSAIRFKCLVPRQNCDSGEFSMVPEKCEFNLGLGPCGKEVSALSLELTAERLTITQITGSRKETRTLISKDWLGTAYRVECDDDRETKQFIYKLSDVLGRIEATSA